ncbi:MAG: hypothetical protein AABY22_10605 [Nanoarchaeota archaeon]
MEKILAKNVEFFDYRNLEKGLWKQYKADAEFILKCDIFNNEINRLIAGTLKNAVIHSKNFEQVEQARTYILVLEELKERFKNIEEPENPDENGNPYETI